MRRLAIILAYGLAAAGCQGGCERVTERLQPQQAAAPDAGAPLDSAKVVEAIRNADVAALKRLLAGRDPDAPVPYRFSLTEALKSGDPASWLKVYLKYNQVLSVYVYEYVDYMCPQAEKNLEKDATRLLGKIKDDPASLLKRETYSGLKSPTPLHVASLLCQEQAARLLIDLGAKVDSRDARGISPLGYATCDSVAALLIERGAKVDARFDNDLSPLHLAIDSAIARRLIAAGAKVDARDACGNTPLHLAVMSRASLVGLISLPAGLSPSRRRTSPRSDRARPRRVPPRSSATRRRRRP